MMLDMADLSDGQVLKADLCIIGAGAAGISIALQFIGQGFDVLLVESGGRRHEPEIQDMYAGSVERPDMHASPDRFRCRQFGGSTTLWGGRCVPFDPTDFETRNYIPHSGWPIAYSELLPFYRDANAICEAGAFAYRIDEAFDRPMRPMIEDFSSDNFSTDHLERFSKPTNFAARYGTALQRASDVRVLLHATATRATFDASGKVVGQVDVTNLAGKTAFIQSQSFVLATGGLEVARLLLANRDRHPDGIGNEHGAVGRYYMCHIAGTMGRIKINSQNSAVWHDYDISADGTYCRRRFALAANAQHRHRVGNFVARLHHPQIANPDHRTAALSVVFLGSRLLPWEYRTRVSSGFDSSLRDYGRHIANITGDPLSAVRFATRMLTGRFLAERKIPSLVVASKANLFSLDFHGEQVPNPDSRVMLDADRDALGVPRLKIDWRYTQQDIETISTSVRLLAEDIERSGVGTFNYDPDTVEAEMIRYGAYGGHHLGTARMGSDPRTSVVDAQCRVHGVENLFIASAATFPTSSQANPTLTIVALALRLAKHLAHQLRVASSPSVNTAPSVA